MEMGRPQDGAMRRLLSLLLHDVYTRGPSESGFSGPAADRYKLGAAEFEAQLAALARVRDDRPMLVSELSGEEREGVPVAITVDDGGVSYYTRVAERLEALGWRGHCLVTTDFIGRPGFLEKRQIQELHARGHLIGTHSVSHPNRFAACKWKEMVREWKESRKALQDVLGDDVTVGSVPGGYSSSRVAQAACEAGLKVLFTSEPETRVRSVGGCIMLGRFTLRRGCRADLAARFARLEPSTLLREWVGWNTKKMLKALLGEGYPRLAEWIIPMNQ